MHGLVGCVTIEVVLVGCARFVAGVLVAPVVAVACASCSGPSVEMSPRNDAPVVVIPEQPHQLDPRLLGDAYGLKISRLLFASLITVNPDTLRPEPDLADRLVQVDDRTYEVRLRHGLRFADGSVLNSEDVLATFRSAADVRFGSRYAAVYRRIVRMQAIGEHVVRFVLDGPYANFVTDLELPILRAEDEHRAVLGETRADPGVSSGPYRLVARSEGALDLEANPHFHRAASVTHRRLRFVVVRDDTTRALRLLAGRADLALNTVPLWLVDRFESQRGFRVHTNRGVGTTYVGVNLQHRALRDPRVRHAIARAIDRRMLIQTKLHGHADIASSWIPPAHWAHDSSVPLAPYDPSASRQLLDQAGWLDPDDRGPTPRFSVTLRTSTDRFRLSMARAIAGMLEQVGIRVVVVPTELATLLADLNRGSFDLVSLQIPEVFEPDVLRWFFSSEFIPSSAVHARGSGVTREARSGANRWRYRNDEVDALLDAGVRARGESERFAVYRRVQHVLARDLPVIPLWHEHNVAITSARLGAYRVPSDGRFGTLVR